VAELVEGDRPASSERTAFSARDGVDVTAIHAAPDEGGASIGVVLHPDLSGVRPLFDDLARRFASHGFAVCAPEPFAHAPADVLGATHDAALGARMQHAGALDDDVQLDDLARAGAMLRDRDHVERLTVLGFCMGGMQTLKAAATGTFDRAVAFYGMIRVPPEWAKGGGLRQPLDTAADVCPTLAIFGGVDPYTPEADIEGLRAAWKDRPDCEIVVYPDGDHGFVHAPERPAHRPDDAADAWRRVTAFLA